MLDVMSGEMALCFLPVPLKYQRPIPGENPTP